MTHHDIQRLGEETVPRELERFHRDPEIDLPVTVVRLQERLAGRSEDELVELLVGVAVALAVTVDGTATPASVLESVIEKSARRLSVEATWDGHLKPKVKRLRWRLHERERAAAQA